MSTASGSDHDPHLAACRHLCGHRDDVIRLAKQRVRLLHANKADVEVLSPGGRFDGRPVDYALSKFQFFACSRCKQPYFGGLKECGAPEIPNVAPGGSAHS